MLGPEYGRVVSLVLCWKFPMSAEFHCIMRESQPPQYPSNATSNTRIKFRSFVTIARSWYL